MKYLGDQSLTFVTPGYREAEENAPKENAAAVSIQRVFRGYSSRYRIYLKR